MPLISVIMPIYNGEKFLRNAIDSVINQSEQDFELLLLNDGSSDDSAAICKEYVAKNTKIVYFERTNHGVAATRNFGISKAKGQLICFMDQDDIMLKCFLEQMSRHIIENDCDLAICSVKRMKDNGELVSFETVSKSRVLENVDVKKLLYQFVAPDICYDYVEKEIWWTVWNCMFSHKFIIENNIEFIHFVSYEDDWLFNIQALTCANKVFLDNEMLYVWRDNVGSESHKHPYITNLYDKQKQLVEYLMKVFLSVEDNKAIIKRFNGVMLARILVSSFYNECMYSSLFNTIHTLKEIIKIEKEKQGKDILKCAINEFVIRTDNAADYLKDFCKWDLKMLKLICNDETAIAFFLNRCCRKRMYGEISVI